MNNTEINLFAQFVSNEMTVGDYQFAMARELTRQHLAGLRFRMGLLGVGITIIILLFLRTCIIWALTGVLNGVNVFPILQSPLAFVFSGFWLGYYRAYTALKKIDDVGQTVSQYSITGKRST